MGKRIDNFIPLHARLAGPQLAGWKPSRIAESGLGYQLLADVKVMMPDGVKLSADVYLPKKPGKYPVILEFSAYNRDLHTMGVPAGNNEIGSPPLMAERGYAVIIFTARGMGHSEGSIQPWQCEKEIDDHFHCIDWASKQPWSNGDVVLFGTSYYGLSQLTVAARNPPALRALFMHEVCTDYYRHILHYGSTPNHDFIKLWMGANFNSRTMHRYIPPWIRALLSHIINRPWLWKRLVQPKIDKVMNYLKGKEPASEVLPWYINILVDSPRRQDSKFGPGSYRDLHHVNVPFVAVQNLGLISLHQFGSYDLFENAGTPKEKKWLILEKAEYELPVYSWQLEALAFFDYILKGIDNGYQNLAKVRYWAEGKSTFNSATDFPIPEATQQKFYLNGVQNNLETHSLQTTPPSSGKNSWLSIPRGVKVFQSIERFETQKLAYHFPITKNMQLAGPITVQLKFSCNEIDSYVVTKLSKLDSQGRSHLLSMGHFRPATRTIDPQLSTRCELVVDSTIRTPLAIDEPVILRFSMTPGAAYFTQGDVLVFEIASRTDLLKGTFKEGFVVTELAVPPYFCRNSLHYGEDTFIEIPLME